MMDLDPRNHGAGFFTRREVENIAATAMRAKKFIFSKAASRLVGQFAHECCDLVLQNRRFAIPPFETMYIEYDCDAFFSTFENTTARVRNPDGTSTLLPGRDVAHGFLLDHGLLRSLAVAATGIPGYDPFGYRLEPRNDFLGVEFSGKYAEWTKLALALGTGIEFLRDEEERQSILDSFALEWRGDPRGLKKPDIAKDMMAVVQNSQGIIRTLWACLLWLNQPKHVRYIDMPAGSRLFRGKRLAYSKHSIIEIDLADDPEVAHKAMHRMWEGRQSPVRHEVRGFFRHLHGDKDHSHAWPLLPDERGHWVCACGRERLWVKEHVRGDSTKGFNTSEYKVKVSQ